MAQYQENFSLNRILTTTKPTASIKQWLVTPVRNDETIDLSRIGSTGSLDTPKFASSIDTPCRDSRAFISPVFPMDIKEEEEEEEDGEDDDTTIEEDDCIQFSMVAEENPMESHPTPMKGGTQTRSPLVDVLNSLKNRSNSNSKPFINAVKQFDPLAEASFSDWNCNWTPFSGPKKALGLPNSDYRKPELTMSLFDLPNEEAKPEDIPRYSQKEWDAMKKEMQGKIEKSSRECQALRTQHVEMEEQLQRELNEKNHMKAIMNEFETMIRTLVKKIETHDEEKNDLEAELDHAALQNNALQQERNRLRGDLQTLEGSFEQLHMKYEELKSINEAYATNEETLRKNVETLKNDVVIADDRYEKLKNHAKDKMDNANAEITKVRTEHQKEVMRFRAQLKSNEIRIKTLESQIEAKESENKQLVSFSEQILIEMEKLK